MADDQPLMRAGFKTVLEATGSILPVDGSCSRLAGADDVGVRHSAYACTDTWTASDPRLVMFNEIAGKGTTPFALKFGQTYNDPQGPWLVLLRDAVFGDASNNVRALRCVKMELGEPDESGRRRPVVVNQRARQGVNPRPRGPRRLIARLEPAEHLAFASLVAVVVGPLEATEPVQVPRPDGGTTLIGHEGTEFAFDNETPRHPVLLQPFALASRPVSNGEYQAFIADGGYRRPEFWLSDGWAAVQASHGGQGCDKQHVP